MKRRIRTLEEAKIILEPYYETILEAMRKSFQQQVDVKDFIHGMQDFLELKPRTKANLVSDFIQSNISTSFVDVDGVKPVVLNDVFGLNVHNEFFVRFKKMDMGFKTGNVNTQQQKSLQGQRTIEGFPDQPTFVFAGYIPDSLWLNVKGYYMACWDGKSLEWFDEFGNKSYEQFTIKFEPTDPTDPRIHKEIEKKIKMSSKLIHLKVDKSD